MFSVTMLFQSMKWDFGSNQRYEKHKRFSSDLEMMKEIKTLKVSNSEINYIQGLTEADNLFLSFEHLFRERMEE